MSAPRLELDFAGNRAHGGTLGIALAAAGAIALALVMLQLHALSTQRAGLELRSAALQRAARSGAAPSGSRAPAGSSGDR